MLHCWGSGSSGQLGLGPKGATEPAISFRRGPNVGREVVQVACGERHTLFLRAGGAVLSCGDNTQGQLGRRTRAPEEQCCYVPEQVCGDLQSLAVTWVSCGKSHSLAVCSNGKVFSWGAGDLGQLGTEELKDCFIPKNIAGLSTHKIIQVACGHYHSVALAKDGRVFSWGQNTHGQLGISKDVAVQASPRQVLSLHGIPLAQVAAGGAHSFALSISGVVYGWGRNNTDQLGLTMSKPVEQIFKPHSIGALRCLDVTYVSCGDEHTAVLTKNGSVYTFGDNSAGQLGHSSSTNKSGPQKVGGIDDPVSHLACGSYHTLVCISDSGQLICFGHGSLHHNECGTSNGNEDQTQVFDISPHLIANNKELKGMKVKQIFAGAFANFATLHNRQVSSSKSKTTSVDSLPKIHQVDEGLIKKWLSSPKNKFKREIEVIFSSPSCLTACFLNPVSSLGIDGCLPVDLEKAEKVFKELTKMNWIADTISSILQKNLIPDLPQSTAHQEAICSFLLLPVCSAALEAQNMESLAMPFAKAVRALSKHSSDLLEELWSMLQTSSLVQIIQMLKKAVQSQLCYYYCYPQCQAMIPLLEGLKKLYKVNRKADYKLHFSSFYIDEIFQRVEVFQDYIHWLIWMADHDPASDEKHAITLCRFPFVFNLQTKMTLLYSASTYSMQQNASLIPWDSSLRPSPLKVHRHNLIEDTLLRLSHMEDRYLKMPLGIIFEEEVDTVKAGPVLSEFFSCVFEEMVKPSYGMFTYCKEDSPMWFPCRPKAEKKKYFLFGILCGLCLYNRVTAYIPFPLAAFKKLLGKKPTLDDLKELNPVIGEGLQKVLDDGVEENAWLYYSIYWEEEDHDLIPDGISVAVNNKNRKDYISKFVDYIFNKSVEEVFGEFKRGFFKVLDERLVHFFEPEELMEVAIGNANYDWKLYEKNAIYVNPYSPTHPTIKMFWKTFHEFELAQKKAFLHFVSGSDRLPVTGMDSLKLRIQPPTSDSEDSIPEALICYHTLLLPTYSTTLNLKTKLLQAVENKVGFYK